MRRVPAIAFLCLLLVTAALPAYAVEVWGSVVNFEGTGQPDTRVEFKSGETVFTAWTDGDGYYEFEEDLPAGTYNVTLTRTGYPPIEVPDHPVEEDEGEYGGDEYDYYSGAHDFEVPW